MKPNLTALKRMSELAKQHGVQMERWVTRPATRTLEHNIEPTCGTVGCLCGTYAVYENKSLLNNTNNGIQHYQMMEHLGLSDNQFKWLFQDGYYCVKFNHLERLCDYRTLHEITTEEAVRRLDRFIAYHEKQEQMYEQLITVRQIENQDNILSLALAT